MWDILKNGLKNNYFRITSYNVCYTKLLRHNLSIEKQKEVYLAMTYESGLVMKEMIWVKNLFGKKPNKIKYSKIDIPVLFVSGGIDNASPVRISEKLLKKYKIV